MSDKPWHPNRPEWEKGETIDRWWNVLDYLKPDSRVWHVNGDLYLEAGDKAHRIVMPKTHGGSYVAFRVMRSWIVRGS